MDTYNSIVNVSAKCFDYVSISSDGIWNIKYGESLLQHSFIRFQIQLLLMISIGHIFHYFLKHFDFPRLTSDVLAGIILGPTIFERYFPHASELLFPPVPNQVIGSLLKIGYVLFTFLTTVRMDTTIIRKSGNRNVILGLLLFAFPFTMSQTLEAKFDANINLTDAMIGARLHNIYLYFGSFTATEFIDVSVLLMQLRITNSRLGHIALAISLVSDLAKFSYNNVVSLVLSRLVNTWSRRVGIQTIIYITLYIVFILFMAKRIIMWFIRKTPEGKPMKDLYTNFVFAIVLILSSMGDAVGGDYLLGPSILGLMIPAGSPLATILTSKLDTIVSGLLIPLLYTFCATKFNLWVFISNFDVALNFQMAFIGYGIKLVVTFLLLMFIKVEFRDAITLALILNVKGPREMGAFYSYTNIELRDLDSTSGVFLIFLLTSFVPPLVKRLYDPTKHYVGYKKKCVQHTPYDVTLEILACAHKQEDVLAAIKVLEFSNPTKESPLSIYGLCLEELLGSYTPYIINHQLGQRSSISEGSRSQPLIDIFKYFMYEHKKGAHVSVFTAVSPLKSMYGDICSLAFDKTCSLILLPFHKKWSNKGKLVLNSSDWRNLNISVLERAPCSVGILIDRGKASGLSSIFSSSTIYRIVLLFIGGEDDREAAAFALRMARSSRVKLTIVNFIIPRNNPDENSWDDMLDNETLRGMRQEMSVNANINYVEETVRYGSDTAAIVRSVQGEYDLIIVGRRHETKPEAISGLSQWIELPELGEIGDQLASSDINTRDSILVMQQQIMKASHNSVLN